MWPTDDISWKFTAGYKTYYKNIISQLCKHWLRTVFKCKFNMLICFSDANDLTVSVRLSSGQDWKAQSRLKKSCSSVHKTTVPFKVMSSDLWPVCIFSNLLSEQTTFVSEDPTIMSAWRPNNSVQSKNLMCPRSNEELYIQSMLYLCQHGLMHYNLTHVKLKVLHVVTKRP